jgi:predicted DsbA family dithiol-disulfide isomerase
MIEPPDRLDVHVLVEVWSDVVCPWCYIGKRHLERALADFEQRDQVGVRWRAYELDPAAPFVREGDYAGRLARKYGVAPTQAQAMIDRMVRAAADAGLDFRFDIARPGRTFDAHRVIHLGAARGRQDEVKERLLRAYFTEGEVIGDPDTLVRLGVEAGLDEDETRRVLESDAYRDVVRADEEQAMQLGISGVPFFVIGGRYAVAGAQPPEVLLHALRRAWADALPSLTTIEGEADAAACEGDACAI